MLAIHDCTDSTATFDCCFDNNTTTEHTISSYSCNEIEYPEVEYDKWVESFKTELREWHDNKNRVKTIRAKNVRHRNNNRQMNQNSGRFWHVQL